METDLIESFAPIADEHSRLLILGTMPGVRSLQKQEYYGHPRNAFWPLIAELTGHRPSDDYAAKTAMLHEARIALWDVCRECRREGSLDSNIRGERPNAIAALIARHPAIRAVAFNGQPAARLFRRHIGTIDGRELDYLVLPSTSPAYAIPFERKLAGWRAILPYLT
ncbi:MAG: DNA-deoxyinosine glycosylase [Rikenellaceae bacterium]|nr:DNA-deoxyinosine glycosylase [Rikenellaceae bacterium]